MDREFSRLSLWNMLFSSSGLLLRDVFFHGSNAINGVTASYHVNSSRGSSFPLHSFPPPPSHVYLRCEMTS